jgi:hypothetical protein
MSCIVESTLQICAKRHATIGVGHLRIYLCFQTMERKVALIIDAVAHYDVDILSPAHLVCCRRSILADGRRNIF